MMTLEELIDMEVPYVIFLVYTVPFIEDPFLSLHCSIVPCHTYHEHNIFIQEWHICPV